MQFNVSATFDFQHSIATGADRIKTVLYHRWRSKLCARLSTVPPSELEIKPHPARADTKLESSSFVVKLFGFCAASASAPRSALNHSDDFQNPYKFTSTVNNKRHFRHRGGTGPSGGRKVMININLSAASLILVTGCAVSKGGRTR